VVAVVEVAVDVPEPELPGISRGVAESLDWDTSDVYKLTTDELPKLPLSVEKPGDDEPVVPLISAYCTDVSDVVVRPLLIGSREPMGAAARMGLL
jgi:hypothetical protein